MPKLKSKPAYSLIFAIVMMSLMMIVATGAIGGTRDKIQQQSDTTMSNLYAKMASESAEDIAMLAIKDKEAGYEPSDYSDTAPGTSGATMEYTVVSRAQHNTNNSTYYYTPIPMTGTAAPSDECNYLASADEVATHSCNWNKILYGQSVTIPLYSYDSAYGLLKNPSVLGLTEWSLKVRTPCADGTYEDGCTRYSLDGVSTSYANDASIVLWQLVGEDSSGDTVVSVVPDDKPTTRGATITGRDIDQNTEIYESLINTASSSPSAKYTILQASTSSTKYSDILDYCLGTDPDDGSSIDIEKLYLQLSIVNPLETSTESVPYLEWQLESTMTGGAFADNKAVIVGKGYYEGQSGTFYYPSVVTRGTVGERTSIYTISN